MAYGMPRVMFVWFYFLFGFGNAARNFFSSFFAANEGGSLPIVHSNAQGS